MVNSQRNPDLSSLSIPQFDVSVEAGREELGAVVVELHFPDRHLVASISTHDLVLAVHFPQFDLENFIIASKNEDKANLSIIGAGQEEVCTGGEPLDAVDALRVTLVHVDLLLRNEASENPTFWELLA